MSTPITEIPAGIASYSEHFGSLFGSKRQFRHFQEYLTGQIGGRPRLLGDVVRELSRDDPPRKGAR